MSASNGTPGKECGTRFRATGTALRDVIQASESVNASIEAGSAAPRAAVCITGQLRGLPLALYNWKISLFPLLAKDQSVAIDLFVFTSNTSSFSVWQTVLQSLEPVAVEVVQVWRFSRGGQRKRNDVRQCAPSGLGCDSVAFNVAQYPRLRHSLYGSLLVQQYQMERCRQRILLHEQAMGIRYASIARLRTDIVFSGIDARRTLPTVQVDCLRTPSVCPAVLEAARRVARHACVDAQPCTPLRSPAMRDNIDGAREGCTSAWAVIHDWFMLGSREAILAHLQGLRLLHNAGPRISLRGLQDSWVQVILPAARKELTKALHDPIAIFHPWKHGARRQPTDPSIAVSAGACTGALGGIALLRAAGRNVGRYFIDWEQNATSASDVACLAQGNAWRPCSQFVQQWWAMPSPQVAKCIGLQYDELPDTRDRVIRLCQLKYSRSSSKWRDCVYNGLLMGHVSSFGPKQIIGDMGNKVHRAAQQVEDVGMVQQAL